MSKIFGAQAKVFMKYSGEIKELAAQISKGLMLSDLTVDFSEHPPYELTGMGEALGFQFWLSTVRSDDDFIDGYNYTFEISTELSHDEIMNDRMHDLSLWLGRYITVICHIDTCVLDSKDGHVFFKA